MITLFVTLYSLLCLHTAVKSSDIAELHVKTVKREEDVTMECNINMAIKKESVVWYRQNLGKVPQYVAKKYPDTTGYRFAEGFNNNRFSFTVNDHKFDINIKEVTEEDGGDYFCGEVDGYRLKFISGTLLQFEGDEMKHCPTPGTVKTSDIEELHVKTVKRGEDVTMECNINMATKKENVVWYRQNFGKVPQYIAKRYPDTTGYRFAEGFNNNRFSFTVNYYKFDLNIKEVREEDGGDYFCVEVDGIVLKFISGTLLQFEGEEMKHFPTTGTGKKNTDQSCTDQIHVLFWLSVWRVGVLAFMIIICTIILIVFKLRSNVKFTSERMK